MEEGKEKGKEYPGRGKVNVPRLCGGFSYKDYVAVLCNLHVQYRYSFAYIESYIRCNFKKNHSSELESINSGVPLDERFVQANLKRLWEYVMDHGVLH